MRQRTCRRETLRSTGELCGSFSGNMRRCASNYIRKPSLTERKPGTRSSCSSGWRGICGLTTLREKIKMKGSAKERYLFPQRKIPQKFFDKREGSPYRDRIVAASAMYEVGSVVLEGGTLPDILL